MVQLKAFRGQFVILYFYPKDNTPGCTKEACAFRDQFQALQKKNAVILGVSPDSVASHQKFAKKHDLPFSLIADTGKEIVNAYGAWGKKLFMGRLFDGTHRVSFLIDPEGRIKTIWPKVKPAEHPQQVLEML